MKLCSILRVMNIMATIHLEVFAEEEVARNGNDVLLKDPGRLTIPLFEFWQV
jgi:hypothetical protein